MTPLRFVLFFWIGLGLLPSTPGYTQDEGSDGENSGVFDLGILGGLLLPANFPGADEVYPSFGPHIGVRTSFATFETGAIWGQQDDRLIAGAKNHILMIPLQMRNEVKFIQYLVYGSIGGHGTYYQTHYSSGRRITGTKLGFNLGGGLIIPDKVLQLRVDLRSFFGPGTTVMIALLAYWSI